MATKGGGFSRLRLKSPAEVQLNNSFEVRSSMQPTLKYHKKPVTFVSFIIIKLHEIKRLLFSSHLEHSIKRLHLTCGRLLFF